MIERKRRGWTREEERGGGVKDDSREKERGWTRKRGCRSRKKRRRQ